MEEQVSKADFDALALRVKAIEGHLQANTDATNRVEANTRDLIETFRSLTGAFSVLQGIGRLAKPVAYIGMAISAAIGVWSAAKGLWK